MKYLIIICRSIINKINGIQRKKKSILIIGSGNDLNEAKAMLSGNKRYSPDSVQIGNSISKETIEAIKNSDHVYICSGVNYSLKEQIINICTAIGKGVFVIPRIYEVSIVKSKVKYIDDLLVLKMNSMCLPRRKEFVKRIFDIVAAVTGIVLTLPLMLCSAALIKFKDGGPVLFSQERLTKGGRPFMLYKFRTMEKDAEKHTGPVFAAKNDCRITKAGRTLRNTRIDELPQLFNVIKGDMSIVGPRPERPHFASRFSEYIPEYGCRLAVKAGITGLAQVIGRYSTAPENKLRLDVHYIKNYSVWLDIYIIFRTIGVIFRKEHADGILMDIDSDNDGLINTYGSGIQIL